VDSLTQRISMQILSECRVLITPFSTEAKAEFWFAVNIVYVQFYTRFLYAVQSFGVDRAAHFRLLIPWAMRLLSQWMLHWWRVAPRVNHSHQAPREGGAAGPPSRGPQESRGAMSIKVKKMKWAIICTKFLLL